MSQINDSEDTVVVSVSYGRTICISTVVIREILCLVWLMPADSNLLSTTILGDEAVITLIGIFGPRPENIYDFVRFPIGIPSSWELLLCKFSMILSDSFSFMLLITLVFVVTDIISPLSFLLICQRSE